MTAPRLFGLIWTLRGRGDDIIVRWGQVIEIRYLAKNDVLRAVQQATGANSGDQRTSYAHDKKQWVGGWVRKPCLFHAELLVLSQKGGRHIAVAWLEASLRHTITKTHRCKHMIMGKATSEKRKTLAANQQNEENWIESSRIVTGAGRNLPSSLSEYRIHVLLLKKKSFMRRDWSIILQDRNCDASREEKIGRWCLWLRTKEKKIVICFIRTSTRATVAPLYDACTWYSYCM